MSRAVGFDQGSILNGGFIEWKRLGLQTENKCHVLDTSKFLFKPRWDVFVEKNIVLEAINKNQL